LTASSVNITYDRRRLEVVAAGIVRWFMRRSSM
jgi:hypothetical protein